MRIALCVGNPRRPPKLGEKRLKKLVAQTRGYKPAQLGVIEAAARSLGCKAILEAYPNMGLTLYGTKDAMRGIKKRWHPAKTG